jgi:ribosome-associated translation inhibitor RaiA
MQTEPRITFRGIDTSPAVEAAVRERIDRLEQLHDRITSCTVVIEAPHRSSQQGKIFQVHVDVVIPGHEIVAGREASHANEIGQGVSKARRIRRGLRANLAP